MTDVTSMYKGRSKVEGKMTDGWEGTEPGEGKISFTLNVTEGGYEEYRIVANNR